MATQVHRRPGGRRATGFTLVEVLLSSSLLLLLIYLVTNLTISGNQAQKYGERQGRVTQLAQSILDDIRSELTSSVFLIQGDAVGNAYLSAADLSAAKPSVSLKLPPLLPTGAFQKETSTLLQSGNGLMFVRQAWSAPYSTTSGSVHRIDVYRVVHYYLAAEGGGPRQGVPWGLNLCKWVSEPIVDGGEIDKVTVPADQIDLLQALHSGGADVQGRTHPKAEVVWLRGSDISVAGNLRQILANGTMVNTPQSPRSNPWKFERDSQASKDDLLNYRHHSIASNFAPAAANIGRFSQILSSANGFPHGFEAQMIGPASARQVLVRLVLVTTNNNGHKAYESVQQIMDARDL